MSVRRWGLTLYILGTVAVAAVAILLLAVLRPETDSVTMALTGAVLLLTGGLVHEIMARHAALARLTDRLTRMRQGYEDLVDLLTRHRDDPGRAGPIPAAAEPLPVPPTAPPQAAPPPTVPSPTVPSTPRRTGSAAPKPAIEESDMAMVVRDALAEQRIEFHLQPIVSLSQRKHRFYEVLSRIRLPDRQLLAPERYLAAAQCERLLPAIDLLLLKQVSQLVKETDRRQHAISFFANVSPMTLLDPSFAAQFLRGVDHQPLRTKLMFELDQHDLTAAVPAVMTMLDDLKRQGYRFSLGQVQQLAIDLDVLTAREIHFIKLDAAFLVDPGLRAQVVTLQARLADRAIELIAEKIETEQQLACAVGLGIAYGQGFLVGEPRPSRRMA